MEDVIGAVKAGPGLLWNALTTKSPQRDLAVGLAMVPLTVADGVGLADDAVRASTTLLRSGKALQKGFMKHGADFGLSGKWNPGRAGEFSRAIHQHVNAGGTRAIQGTYRGNAVTHYLDPSTGLNVMADPAGNYVSGWRLGADQLRSVLSTGRLY